MFKPLALFFCISFLPLLCWAVSQTPSDIWQLYQKALQEKSSQKPLLDLKNTCQKYHFQDSTYTLILEKIAKNYALKNDFDKAIATINEAIVWNKTAKKDINPSFLEGNYYSLAQFYNQQGANSKALEIYDLCIQRALNYTIKSEYLSQSYAQKAKILTKTGDFEKALAQVDIGINLANQRNDQLGLGLCYVEKAKTLILTDKLSEGEAMLNKSITILQKKGAEGALFLAYSYYWFAQYYHSKKEYVKAINLFGKAQKLYAIERNNYMFSTSFIDIGLGYYYLKDYQKALENYEKALKTMDKVSMKVIILDDIAATYWQKKEYQKAFFYYQKALSVVPIGFQSENLFDNPLTNSLKRVDIKPNFLTTLHDKADTWLEYANITKSPVHQKVALDTYLTADKLIDIMRFEHTGTNSKLYWRSKTHAIYEHAIETCYLLKNYEKAFYFFEKSKAVLLNDQLNELSADQQLSAQDLSQEKSFQQQVSELNNRLSSGKESSKNHAVLQNQLAATQTQQEQFIKGLETKNPAYFRYKYDTTLTHLKDVKKYLSQTKSSTNTNSTLLEYFVGDQAIYALRVTPEKTDLLKISPENYSSNAKQFLKYCADNQMINKNYQNFLKNSNQLYEQLFKDLNPKKGRLVIAQDGFFLPFEALSKSAKKAEYLLNDYAISYTYSVQFLLKNVSKKTFSVGDKFMGMSPVNFHKDLNQTPLLGSDISLDNVCDNFYFGKTYAKNEATKKAFFENAPKYQIVHLYTHAQADSSDQEPMIYFADSVLKLSELSALARFKTQLLVLSACKTAVGRNAKGEGILSLSRGFATQGIPATLTTLWSVENQSTYTLNELFYRYLSKGDSKDIALQKAKIEFLKTQSGEKQLPTFWAAAVLVGDAEAINSGFQPWVFIALAIGLITFWYTIRNRVFKRN